jgi:hypothetical protein
VIVVASKLYYTGAVREPQTAPVCVTVVLLYSRDDPGAEEVEEASGM